MKSFGKDLRPFSRSRLLTGGDRAFDKPSIVYCPFTINSLLYVVLHIYILIFALLNNSYLNEVVYNLSFLFDCVLFLWQIQDIIRMSHLLTVFRVNKDNHEDVDVDVAILQALLKGRDLIFTQRLRVN